MNKPQKQMHVVVTTPEQSLIMDIWQHYSVSKDTNTLWAGGLTILEKVQQYLREHHLIDSKGQLYKRVEI